MTRKELNMEEATKRISSGELVVFLDEEYYFRQWFWFPKMSESDLVAFWNAADVNCYYFDPSFLPGDMVEVPEEDYDNYTYDMGCGYDASVKHNFLGSAVWDNGFHALDTWRAHTHQRDDSWLKKPGVK